MRPLATEADYEQALTEVSSFFEHQPAPCTLDAQRFDALSALIECYEAQHWPITDMASDHASGGAPDQG